MPLIESNFKSKLLSSPHFQTILPKFMRKVRIKPSLTERLELSDGDFLDLDWHYAQGFRDSSRTLIVLSHGLEGSSRSTYARSFTKRLIDSGYDVLAWNFRGCSGELNRLLPSYHSGKTDDLLTVVNHSRECGYQSIFLAGISIGGNISLKLAGELGENAAEKFQKVFAVSSPLDLAASAAAMAEPRNRIYMDYFLRSLKPKIRAKKKIYPQQLDLDGLNKIRNFQQFDSRYIAPFFGFSSAEDYWQKASSLPWLKEIKIPCMLLTSKDDPFLTEASIPRDFARYSDNFLLEVTSHGGHVGFFSSFPWSQPWYEKQALNFFGNVTDQSH